MNVFNEQSRPRVLFEDVPETLAADLQKLVPTSKVVAWGDPVHEKEFDILVTFSQDSRQRSRHIHVLAFGATTADSVGSGTQISAIIRTHNTLANELSIPNSVNVPMANLLKSTVIPHIEDGPKVTWKLQDRTRGAVQGTTSHTGDLNGNCQPLIHIGSEKYVYAYRRPRTSGKDSAVSIHLPSETSNHAAWLQMFLEIVSEIDPESVPKTTTWRTTDAWSTPRLHQAVGDLENHRSAWAKAEADFLKQESDLNERLQLESVSAENGPQRVLTGTGDELVDAVVQMLRGLGFSVQEMDDHHDARTRAKLEDLRITDEADPQWNCLAEVKGYSRGAKVNDVSQITGRPAVAFAMEFGDAPVSVWHIVNIYRETDPTLRPKAIDNDQIDLRPLTDAGGALIDTRSLFQAWKDVETKVADAEKIRKTMRETVTRWGYLRQTAVPGGAGSAN